MSVFLYLVSYNSTNTPNFYDEMLIINWYSALHKFN